jgi:GR25 family glycosyltransferase involved in LPS biosynthesis
MNLNYFDGILYLNLSFRTDRRKEIEGELDRLSIPLEKRYRIEAHYDELNGARGCVLSHLQALDFALEKGWKNVLILEDDCTFSETPEEIETYVGEFIHNFHGEWDVFFLGTHIKFAKMTHHPAYVQVHFSLRSHAYAVNGSYISRLRAHFQSTYEGMQNDLFFLESLPKALDRKWVDLQIADRWFAGIKPIAFQSNSYSDIEKGMKEER